MSRISNIYTFIITVLILLGSVNSNAQQRLPKYENVYKDAMAAGNKEYIYALFLEFLEQNPGSNRANLYFQIGTLAYDLSKTFDPIAQYNNYITYANKTDKSLKLCLQYLNDEELKRDNDLFQGIQKVDKKLTKSEIQEYIDKIIADNEQKSSSVHKIHEAYYNLSKNYIVCQNLYKALCNDFINIKEIYLMLSSDIFEKMEDMQTLSDSVEYYLKEYKDLLENNPIEGYNLVDVTTESIKIFRVDGLSTADFRAPKTVIWDYKSWAERFVHDVDGFANVYQEVINAGNTLSKRISTFNTNRALSDNYLAYEIDDDILDSLNMFGYYPTLNRYMSYKEEKLYFLTLSRRKINSADYDNNGKLGMKDKLYYYDKLQQEYDKLEHMRLDLEAYIASDDTTDFAAMNFNNKADFIEYVRDEQLENEIEVNNAFENLNKYYIKKENNIRRTNYLSHKKQQIPLFLGNGFYRSTQPQTYVSKCIEASSSGIYIAGSQISKEGFATAYVALCAPDSSSIVWLKTIDIGRVMYDNSVTALYPTFDGGCFALVIAKNVSDPDLMNSTVIQYNAKGTEVKRFALPEKTLGIGRYISYDDVNEQLMMAFYGNEEFWFTPDRKLVIQKINLENNILMSAELKLNGSIVDIIPAKNNGLLVVGNYFSIEDEKGLEHKLKADGAMLQSNVFTALFDNSGKLIKVNRYAVDGGTGYAVEAIKTSSNTINIIGQKGQARRDSSVPFSSGELIYMSIDSEGKLLFSNQKSSK